MVFYLGVLGGIYMNNLTQKHLSLEDRNFIEQSLNQGMSFKEIAKVFALSFVLVVMQFVLNLKRKFAIL